MTHSSSFALNHPILRFASALLLAAVLALASPRYAQAQSTYGSGTYGQDVYGGSAITNTAPTVTNAPILSPTPTATPAGGSSFPLTGAQIGLWASLGTILVAIGVVLSLRLRRRLETGQNRV